MWNIYPVFKHFIYLLGLAMENFDRHKIDDMKY